MTLANGWVVESRREPHDDSTGGNFSYQYSVVHMGSKRRAFLKAIDISQAMKADQFMVELELLAKKFNFEEALLKICGGRNMDRIVRALDSGWTQVGEDPFHKVPYLIFEEADGDIRQYLAQVKPDVDTVAWKLRCLHQIAVGLAQLHRADMAHQDTKPSNVLNFEKLGAKLGDLGRGAHRSMTAPHDCYSCAGDPAYAPPEGLYGYIDLDWNRRRVGCDLYHLGSMLAYFFLDASAISLLLSEIPPDMRPGTWGGTFQDVLPFLRDAFNRNLNNFHGLPIHASMAVELKQIFLQLCEPDPTLRGDRSRALNSLALERFVSRLNTLASRAEARVLK